MCEGISFALPYSLTLIFSNSGAEARSIAHQLVRDTAQPLRNKGFMILQSLCLMAHLSYQCKYAYTHLPFSLHSRHCQVQGMQFCGKTTPSIKGLCFERRAFFSSTKVQFFKLVSQSSTNWFLKVQFDVTGHILTVETTKSNPLLTFLRV